MFGSHVIPWLAPESLIGLGSGVGAIVCAGESFSSSFAMYMHGHMSSLVKM